MRAVAAEIVIAGEDEELDLRVSLHNLAIGLGGEEDGFEGDLRPIEQVSEENMDPGPLRVEGFKVCRCRHSRSPRRASGTPFMKALPR